MKRRLTIAAFSLALLLGPVAAVCGSCCPEAAPREALTAPSSCCGDCEPTVERTPDPASLTSKSTAAPSDSHALRLVPAVGSPAVERISRLGDGVADATSPPRITPSPLRL